MLGMQEQAKKSILISMDVQIFTFPTTENSQETGTRSTRCCPREIRVIVIFRALYALTANIAIFRVFLI